MPNRPQINDPRDFYTGDAPSLYWEMTICQSLATAESPYQAALVEAMPYGGRLASFLAARLPLDGLAEVVEVGGGYGTLMAEMAPSLGGASVTMVDISPRFLSLQREKLASRPGARFIEGDALDVLGGSRAPIDLLIANENLGDLKTVDALDAGLVRKRARKGPPFGDDPFEASVALIHDYQLDIPSRGPLTLNLGALALVEALASRVEAAFISEHSADVRAAPPYDFLTPEADGQPRRIELKDHAEYSIRFDHLEKVARRLGYEVERVWMPAFLGLRHDDGARFMAQAECVGNERAEIINEFMHHAKEYECMFLQRKKGIS